MRAFEDEVVRAVAPRREAAVGCVDQTFVRKKLGNGARNGETAEA